MQNTKYLRLLALLLGLAMVAAACGGDDDPEETILEHRWHSDVTYTPTPPMGSILRAVELPPYGGDTEWTNLAAAYVGLSAPLKTMIQDLTAIHHNVLHLVRGEPNQLQRDFESVRLRARHPVVSIHPETGEKVLYVQQGTLVTRRRRWG